MQSSKKAAVYLAALAAAGLIAGGIVGVFDNRVQSTLASPTIKGLNPNAHVDLPPVPAEENSTVQVKPKTEVSSPQPRLNAGSLVDHAAIWTELEIMKGLQKVIEGIGQFLMDVKDTFFTKQE